MATDRLVRFVERVGWSACLGSIALAAFFPGLARLPEVQWSPWMAGLLVLGIPHGAFDHRVGAELRRREGGGAGIGFYAAYLSAGALVLAAWSCSPALASLGFLAVAAAHFGQGDLYWSRESGLARRTGSLGYRASLISARSLVPIALPLLAFPMEFSSEATALASRLFGRSGWSVPPLAITWGVILILAVSGLQMGWAAYLGLRGDEDVRRAAVVDISETLLLMATFWIVPPVLALASTSMPGIRSDMSPASCGSPGRPGT